ncbi:hypothetical protein ES703_26785 [subsurface metagenome]
MRQGVPPRICPTFQSWIISPATPATQQTTAATPKTAAIPGAPVCPIRTIIKAAIRREVKVRPEIGLEEEPMIPTRYPATAAKRRAMMIMTIAVTREEPMLCVNTLYRKTIGIIKAMMEIIMEGKGRSLSVRIVSDAPSALTFFTSANERPIPVTRLFRILKSV